MAGEDELSDWRPPPVRFRKGDRVRFATKPLGDHSKGKAGYGRVAFEWWAEDCVAVKIHSALGTVDAIPELGDEVELLD